MYKEEKPTLLTRNSIAGSIERNVSCAKDPKIHVCTASLGSPPLRAKLPPELVPDVQHVANQTFTTRCTPSRRMQALKHPEQIGFQGFLHSYPLKIRMQKSTMDQDSLTTGARLAQTEFVSIPRLGF